MKHQEIIKKLESELNDSINAYIPDFSYEKKKIDELCPEFLLDLSMDYDIILAGGMVTSLFCRIEINDIDIYLKNEYHIFPFISELLQNSTVLAVTDKSIVVSHSETTINVVLFKTFKDCFDIFSSFDFTVCMGAYDFSEGKFYFHKNFMKHNAQRTLVFNSGTDFPLVSALRIKKYIEKGYTISKLEFVRVLLACVKLDINSYKDLESHVGGMYGVRLEDMIDTSIEFDLSNAIEQLVAPNKSIDEAVALSNKEKDRGKSKIKELLSRFNPKGVKMISDSRLIVYPSGRVSSLDKYMDIKNAEAYTGYILLYKYAKKTKEANVFSSFYRPEFKYEIGKEVQDLRHGIHCGVADRKNDFTFSDRSDRVLLELKVHTNDLMLNKSNSGSNLQVKKAQVISVKKDQYICYLDDEVENIFNLLEDEEEETIKT